MSTILGVFAKRPIPGQVKTRLGQQIGMAESASIYECFLRDIFDRFSTMADTRVIGYAPDVDESRIWFSSFCDFKLWPQPNVSLGERIRAFFEEHTKHQQRAVLIGSDSPTIPAATIETALEQLTHNDCVIGPAEDGGYYLIGLREEALRARLFEEIEWSTEHVFEATKARLKEAHASWVELDEWYDVDCKETLAKLQDEIANGVELPHTAEWLAQHEMP